MSGEDLNIESMGGAYLETARSPDEAYLGIQQKVIEKGQTEPLDMNRACFAALGVAMDDSHFQQLVIEGKFRESPTTVTDLYGANDLLRVANTVAYLLDTERHPNGMDIVENWYPVFEAMQGKFESETKLLLGMDIATNKFERHLVIHLAELAMGNTEIEMMYENGGSVGAIPFAIMQSAARQYFPPRLNVVSRGEKHTPNRQRTDRVNRLMQQYPLDLKGAVILDVVNPYDPLRGEFVIGCQYVDDLKDPRNKTRYAPLINPKIKPPNIYPAPGINIGKPYSHEDIYQKYWEERAIHLSDGYASNWPELELPDTGAVAVFSHILQQLKSDEERTQSIINAFENGAERIYFLDSMMFNRSGLMIFTDNRVPYACSLSYLSVDTVDEKKPDLGIKQLFKTQNGRGTTITLEPEALKLPNAKEIFGKAA